MCACPAAAPAQVSEYWLLAEALWPPLKTAITMSVGIVLVLKLMTTACLWCLRRGDAKEGDGGGAAAPSAPAFAWLTALSACACYRACSTSTRPP